MTQTSGAWARDLDTFYAGIGARRRARDDRNLALLFREAAHVPVMRAALDWARTHDVKFIVDHTTDAGGYYIAGSGVVAISHRRFNDRAGLSNAVGTLVHEIRHAWQDYYRMIPTGTAMTFSDYMIRTALIEADADAHGNLARKQHDAHGLETLLKRLPDDDSVYVRGMKRHLADARDAHTNPAVFLREAFIDWFEGGLGRFYGRDAAGIFAKAHALPYPPPEDFKIEFKQDEPSRTGIACAGVRDVAPLGRLFGGGDYIAGAPAGFRDHLVRTALSRDMALRFYEASSRQSRIASHVRKHELQNRFKR